MHEVNRGHTVGLYAIDQYIFYESVNIALQDESHLIWDQSKLEGLYN